ncbi:kinase-like domain-containing protein [Gigaspora rosea]|uniref:Kinase-like domain-containing protein n=1 Tax=Gigaspora rosea TaxID=44941 RepID=A0A397UL84_9GLOM|nr:kinase-like domain-containing protein [Gigaspora rosea]
MITPAIFNEKDIEYIDYNKFTLPELIGTGGFGDVFKYELKELNVAVVLKCLRFDTAPNEEIIKLIDDFIKECKLLLSVSEDPNIIKFYGVTKDSNGHYNMVLQYANEGTLQQYLKTNFQQLRWVDKLEVADGIARGLSSLHARDIIHRDLHSRNILIHRRKPKIADFGASKQINKETIISDSDFIGVLEYTDPQCIIGGEAKRNKKSDIYSFGIIL